MDYGERTLSNPYCSLVDNVPTVWGHEFKLISFKDSYLFANLW